MAERKERLVEATLKIFTHLANYYTGSQRCSPPPDRSGALAANIRNKPPKRSSGRQVARVDWKVSAESRNTTGLRVGLRWWTIGFIVAVCYVI